MQAEKFQIKSTRSIVNLIDVYPQLRQNSTGLSDRQRVVKRAFDLVFASLALIIALPLIVAIAIAIKSTSKGPVIFIQDRVGEGGRHFKIFKFRSMVENAEALQPQMNEIDEDGHLIHKHENDPRVTTVGKFIRKTSLDELPQLVNVIRGEMSVVGPRPELPWIVERYEDWQHRRFDIPQGITGWWQISGRSDKPCHLHTELDIEYIEKYSFWMDVRIILMTLPALLRGKGAY